jgi:hypothetical protein
VEEKTMPLLEVKNLHVEIDGKTRFRNREGESAGGVSCGFFGRFPS